MKNKSIETKILESIKNAEGEIFSSDYVRYGEQSSVNKALESWQKDYKDTNA